MLDTDTLVISIVAFLLGACLMAIAFISYDAGLFNEMRKPAGCGTVIDNYVSPEYVNSPEC